MTVSQVLCTSCASTLREGAKFCDECGIPTRPASAAEYKQVTVLFADVVHSMAIAAAVGPERLREIMAELVKRSTAVVQRYGGTVDKFTGDGIMALFGAPIALEDHAFRACLSALEIQQQAQHLGKQLRLSDAIAFQLRIGLNSGQVIAGDMGAGPMGYTAIGEHVGMAQRMESVAPPGGVMLSDSTSRLVDHMVTLSDPEAVHIKGSDDEVSTRRLISAVVEHEQVERHAPTFVGRSWEINSISGILDEAMGGAGGVVNIVGPAGIGKSRLAQVAAAAATGRGLDVFTTYCESHASDIPFNAVARLLHAGFGIKGLDPATARAHVLAQIPDADPEDILLLNDLLGIADGDTAEPLIEADARRRRLTGLINAAVLARTTPALYVIEDVHWIDEVSESMIAGFLTVIPQSVSTVLITSRPEYRGVLSRIPGAQTLALRPLNHSHISALARELLGTDLSVATLTEQIAGRAAGNPFFVEEIVRDLAGRGVLTGTSGDYRLCGDVEQVSVPATLQTTIAARIDRLSSAAKQALTAAAVIGSRFSPELLLELGIEPELDELLTAELVDQVKFTRGAEFAFRHPLIRTVAYESQLKSARAQLHRRLASLIEARWPESVDENAALIAEHLDAAGDLHAAFAWHMRAGTWSTNRSITAAHTSWRKARQIADRLPDNDPDRIPMKIAPRTLLCGSAWRAEGSGAGIGADLGFDELRELCGVAGDKRSLAIGMAGAVVVLYTRAQRGAASQLASELEQLLDSVDDPTLTIALAFQALAAKLETAEMRDVLALAGKAVDAADGDPRKGDLIVGSPLAATFAMRSIALWSLGISGWKDDVRRATDMCRGFDPTTLAGMTYFTNGVAIPHGVWLPDSAIVHETGQIVELAERSGDDLALDMARTAHGVALLHCSDPDWHPGMGLLGQVRDEVFHNRYSFTALPLIECEIARAEAHLGCLDDAIERSRAVVDDLFDSGGCMFTALACSTLVEALLARRGEGDLVQAQAATDRLAKLPTDPGFVVNEITVLSLRAQLAQARGDDSYGELVKRYREMAESLGFEWHIAAAKAM